MKKYLIGLIIVFICIGCFNEDKSNTKIKSDNFTDAELRVEEFSALIKSLSDKVQKNRRAISSKTYYNGVYCYEQERINYYSIYYLSAMSSSEITSLAEKMEANIFAQKENYIVLFDKLVKYENVSINAFDNNYTKTESLLPSATKVYNLDIEEFFELGNEKIQYLKSLSIENESNSYSIGFRHDKYDYILTVDNNIDNIEIKGEKYTESSTIDGLGSYSLSTGKNIFEITLNNSNIHKTYNIEIIRAYSDNALIKSIELKIDNSVIPLEIKNDTFNYNLILSDFLTKNISFNVNAVSPGATYTLKPFTQYNYNQTIVEIIVLAENEINSNTYTFNLNRPEIVDIKNIRTGSFLPLTNYIEYSINFNFNTVVDKIEFQGLVEPNEIVLNKESKLDYMVYAQSEVTFIDCLLHIGEEIVSKKINLNHEVISVPEFSIDTGEIETSTTISLLGSDDIYYSINDSDFTLYTQPIEITQNSRVAAYSLKNNCKSKTIIKNYTVITLPEVTFTTTYPTDQLENVSTWQNIIWQLSGETENILYDVYFSTDTNPNLYQENLNTNSCSLYELNNNMTYYYKIVAKYNGEVIEETKVKKFTTKDLFFNNSVKVFSELEYPSEALYYKTYNIKYELAIDSNNIAHCITSYAQQYTTVANEPVDFNYKKITHSYSKINLTTGVTNTSTISTPNKLMIESLFIKNNKVIAVFHESFSNTYDSISTRKAYYSIKSIDEQSFPTPILLGSINNERIDIVTIFNVEDQIYAVLTNNTTRINIVFELSQNNSNELGTLYSSYAGYYMDQVNNYLITDRGYIIDLTKGVSNIIPELELAVPTDWGYFKNYSSSNNVFAYRCYDSQPYLIIGDLTGNYESIYLGKIDNDYIDAFKIYEYDDEVLSIIKTDNNLGVLRLDKNNYNNKNYIFKNMKNEPDSPNGFMTMNKNKFIGYLNWSQSELRLYYDNFNQGINIKFEDVTNPVQEETTEDSLKDSIN